MPDVSPFEQLKRRCLVDQVTNENLATSLTSRPGEAIYVGFDPTARSLHLGHLLPVMVLAQVQRMGMRPIVLVGGATGMIGDPSGRSGERNLLTREDVEANSMALKAQLSRFVSFDGTSAATMVDNYEWIAPQSHLEWLRDVGKHFTVNYMLSKESVRRRLEDRDSGISYTEFSYMLLQAYDFLHLRRALGCRIQGGGSDQWGNITAGIELIRRVLGEEALGVTFPLVTTSSGDKFGKSEGNAIWLDPNMTTPFRFYQYWINADDRDVEQFFRFFTFLDLEEIDGICSAHRRDPGKRSAQRRLATEVTQLVHGSEETDRAERASAAVFGVGRVADLSIQELHDAFGDVPSATLSRTRLDGGMLCVDLLVEIGAAASKTVARRLIEGGAVLVNDEKATLDSRLSASDLLKGGLALVGVGKRGRFLVAFS